MLLRASTLAATLLLAGCPSDPPAAEDAAPACTLAFIGDKAQPMKLEATVLGVKNKQTLLKEGDEVPLIFPPQGGRVVFIGAKVANVDPCAVKLSGAIRDPVTKQVRIDNRTINLKPNGMFGESVDGDISTFSNVPMCPNQWASTDAFEQTFVLELTVTDRLGRSASVEMKVKPTCAELDKAEECLCICKQGYVLGEKCGGDAGTAVSDVGPG